MNYWNLFDIIWYYLSLYESVACVYSVRVYLRLLGPKDEVRQLEGDTAALAAEPANPSLALVRKGYWKSNVWQVVAMTAMISHDMPWTLNLDGAKSVKNWECRKHSQTTHLVWSLLIDLWGDTNLFHALCNKREKHSPILGTGSPKYRKHFFYVFHTS